MRPRKNKKNSFLNFIRLAFNYRRPGDSLERVSGGIAAPQLLSFATETMRGQMSPRIRAGRVVRCGFARELRRCVASDAATPN